MPDYGILHSDGKPESMAQPGVDPIEVGLGQVFAENDRPTATRSRRAWETDSTALQMAQVGSVRLP